MLDTYILDDIDDFDPDSVEMDSDSDDYLTEKLPSEDILEGIDSYISDDTSSLVNEDLGAYSFNDEDNALSNLSESQTHQTTFTGHSLGWNGRCRVCSCGKWAGYGDTCANCGHFYNQHI